MDGIRYSVETIDLVFHRVERNLDKIAALPSESDDLGPCIVEAMSDVWAFVDSVHRLRRLVQHTPGVKQKLPEVQLFLRNSSTIESLRNFVQHFPTEINEFVHALMPLWGVLSWACTNETTGEPESRTIAPGTFFRGAKVLSCTFDREDVLMELSMHPGTFQDFQQTANKREISRPFKFFRLASQSGHTHKEIICTAAISANPGKA